jgi:tRNA(adenine34) deaminase
MGIGKDPGSKFDPVPWMRLALEEAQKAFTKNEVPVGAVIVFENELISAAHNLVESTNDATAHAEILAVKEAGKKLGTWRLNKAKLVVTLEPCPMCTSALMLSRVEEIYFGASDVRLGACGSLFDLAEDLQLPHQIKTYSGILQEDCKNILNNFFTTIRKPK